MIAPNFVEDGLRVECADESLLTRFRLLAANATAALEGNSRCGSDGVLLLRAAVQRMEDYEALVRYDRAVQGDKR